MALCLALTILSLTLVFHDYVQFYKQQKLASYIDFFFYQLFVLHLPRAFFLIFFSKMMLQ